MGPLDADPMELGGEPDTILVADSNNHAIRRVTTGGFVTTLAGDGRPGFHDGLYRQAQFNDPQGLARDEEGNVYVADAGNFRIRKIDAKGVVSTLAGSGAQGADDGPGDQATFTALRGLAYGQKEQCLYVADQHAVRKLDLETGQVTTIIGQVKTPAFLLEGQFGAGPAAALRSPCGLTCIDDPTREKLLIADQGNHAIRLVDILPVYGKSYMMTTLVGDETWPATRWGRFRDGLPWAEGPAYASLGDPRGVLGLSVDRALVSNGNGLAMLSHPCRALPGNGRRCHLSVPEKLKAGFADRAVLGVTDLLGKRDDRKDVRYHYTLTLVEGTTGKALVDPETGKPLAPVVGSCKAAGTVEAQLLVPVPGPVTARLTVVSDEGVTLHTFKTLDVLP